MRADLPQKLSPPPADHNFVSADCHSVDFHADWLRLANNQTSLDDPLQQNAIETRPKQRFQGWKFGKFKQNINFHLTKLVVDKAKVLLVQAQRLSINLPTICATMTVRTQGDQIFILVRFAISPRHDVVNIGLDIAAGWDCAAMPRLY